MNGSQTMHVDVAASRRTYLARRFVSRYGLLLLGGAIVAAMSLLALFAPLLTAHDPTAIDVNALFQPPGPGHLLGTDALGRDLWARMLFGARASLWVGFTAVAIAASLGTALGLLAGYLGGIVDEIIMRITDVMLCFPSFFLILAVVAFLEPSLTNIMVVIGLTSWMGVARLVRAEALRLREQDFVLAARLAGSSRLRIMTRHVLPNALAPVLVSATLGVAGAILTESALSFLGLGVQPPDPSWGTILMDGKSTLTIAPWISIFPGLAILVTVLGYNLLGESLRDILDPRLARDT